MLGRHIRHFVVLIFTASNNVEYMVKILPLVGSIWIEAEYMIKIGIGLAIVVGVEISS